MPPETPTRPAAGLRPVVGFDADGGCFGCGADNPAGLKMTFETDGSSLYADLSVPPHLCGWRQIVHGGVLATILDEIMSWTAINLLQRLILTKSMTVSYHRSVPILTPLQVEGRVARRTGDREAVVEAAIYGPEGRLSTAAEGVFALFTPADARRRRLLPEAVLARFEGFVAGKR